MLQHVELSWSEVIVAAMNGVLRMVAARKNGLHPANGLTHETQTWDYNINGAITELAFAKAANLCPHLEAAPDRVGDFRSGVEVRGTHYDGGCLMLHDRDHDDRPYVLVTGRAPSFVVRGWLYGREAKQVKYWRDDLARPCYAVPQSDLRPMEDLP